MHLENKRDENERRPIQQKPKRGSKGRKNKSASPQLANTTTQTADIIIVVMQKEAGKNGKMTF